MDEIREKINNLIDITEKNSNNIDKELFLYKIAIICSVLKVNTFLGFSHSKRQISIVDTNNICSI